MAPAAISAMIPVTCTERWWAAAVAPCTAAAMAQLGDPYQTRLCGRAGSVAI